MPLTERRLSGSPKTVDARIVAGGAPGQYQARERTTRKRTQDYAALEWVLRPSQLLIGGSDHLDQVVAELDRVDVLEDLAAAEPVGESVDSQPAGRRSPPTGGDTGVVPPC
jgi:ribosome biogenesis SPOUT family RNA methylase Rps3